MKRVYVKQLPLLIGESVTVAGFAQVIRDQKRMQFIVLRDKTGLVQLFHEKIIGESDSISTSVSTLTQESTIAITGTVISNPNAKTSGIEIKIETIKIESLAKSPLPITRDSALDLQMDWRALSLRQPENALTLRVQTTLEMAMREFWCKNEFIEIHSPKLMGVASESGSELFQLEYFGKKATLAQSPQFYKQMAMAAGLDRIFEIGPVFRANPSFTSRHDTEFISIDVEISWIESHEEVMKAEETLLNFAISRVKEKHGEEIEKICGKKVIVPTVPFPRLPLSEARKILRERGHEIADEDDLDPQGERMVAEYILEQYDHEFVFVTDYPVSVRPFYHKRYEDRPTVTKSFDLLWKGLEITTGAQREHQIDQLKHQAKEKSVDLDSIKHYLSFFQYGCPPHGGFGLGLTRLLMILLSRKNVREVTYIYRGPNRLTP